MEKGIDCIVRTKIASDLIVSISDRELIAACGALSKEARQRGVLSLEAVIEVIKDSIITRGISLSLVGNEPEVIEKEMSKIKEKALRDYKRKLEIVIASIVSIQSGENTGEMQERLILMAGMEA